MKRNLHNCVVWYTVARRMGFFLSSVYFFCVRNVRKLRPPIEISTTAPDERTPKNKFHFRVHLLRPPPRREHRVLLINNGCQVGPNCPYAGPIDESGKFIARPAASKGSCTRIFWISLFEAAQGAKTPVWRVQQESFNLCDLQLLSLLREYRMLK